MISVVIPVFNSVNFIEQAINSAAPFDIVNEIILVEDGSEDESYTMCEQLVIKYPKVKLFTHEGRKNKGAAASRNLGIRKASNDWIAFLDADDYFLPNRFDSFKKYFNQELKFEGVYEPIQYFNGSNKIYGINRKIQPKKLTYYLIRGTYGHFHTNGLIVKKEMLIKAGLFVESLDLHQDSDLWIKLSYYGRLIPGLKFNEPVAKVRRHVGNRIWKGTSNFTRYKQLKVTWEWAKNENIGVLCKIFLFRKLINYRFKLVFSFVNY